MFLGKITFIRECGGVLAESQSWNPDDLSKAERSAIAAALRAIAQHMLKDEFKDKNQWKKYPLSKTRRKGGG